MRQPKNLKVLGHFRDIRLPVKKIEKMLSSLIINVIAAEHESGSEEGFKSLKCNHFHSYKKSR